MIEANYELTSLTTFRCVAYARYFSSFGSGAALEVLLSEAGSLIDTRDIPIFILGGGSNILLTKNLDAVVAKNEVKGIEVVREDADHVFVKAGAGENWHSFVQYCIRRNWAGLENLSYSRQCWGIAHSEYWSIWSGDE